MFTTLDGQPQESMVGDAPTYHTIAACHFASLEHAEHWMNKLIPTDKNGTQLKWSQGRAARKAAQRYRFIENLATHAADIDFAVNCVSTNEGEMSWFAWAFYMQNRSLVRQRMDQKGRNCLLFPINSEKEIQLPVLRAGYLIWYHNVVRCLADIKGIRGKLLSDNFCADGSGQGKDKAHGVRFVNFLLEQSGCELRVSLPLNERLSACDKLSDYFAGWVNSVRNEQVSAVFTEKLKDMEESYGFMDNVIFQTKLNVVDENGEDVTQEVKTLVAQGAPRSTNKT